MTSRSLQYRYTLPPMMGGEGENIKSNMEQKVLHESTSYGKSEHEQLRLWGLKKAAAVKQLSAEAQGALCLLFYHGSFSARSIELVAFSDCFAR